MTLLEFANSLSIKDEKSAIRAHICEFVNNHVFENQEHNIDNFIVALSEDKFTAFGSKLGYCRNYCLEELNREENLTDEIYSRKLKETLDLLNGLSKVYEEVNDKRNEEKRQLSEETALSHQKDVLREINEKIKTFKSEIESAKNDIKNANESFNEKIFTLLINTVAILGIFVTIAFAGFGVVSIFSNIDLKTALVSEEAFVKNIFYLLLTSFLSYNLLLLLVYFIFKLSRPLINLKTQKKDGKSDEIYSFSQSINLTPFIWIDVVLGVITLIVCLLSIVLW